MSKPKLQPIEKRILLMYAIVIGILLISSILLKVSLQIFEVSGWSYFIFSKTYFIIIPVAIIATIILYKIINKQPIDNVNTNAIQKGKTIIFIIGIIVNFMLLFAGMHIGAKFYNMYGPNQKQVNIEGEIINTFTKNEIKRKNTKRYYITIFEKNLQKEIKFESKKRYDNSELFNEVLTLGSLGFLYKK